MTIIQNQNITKRRKLSFGHNNKSAGTNSSFMGHFSQKPVRTRSTGIRDAKRVKGISLFEHIRRSANSPNQKQTVFTRSHEEKPRSSGFSFPIPSFATLTVIAGTVILALAVLKWDDFSIKLPENHVFQSGSADITEQHISRYAAAGVSGISSILQFPEITIKPDSLTNEIENEALAQENNNLQDLIISFKWQEYRVKKGDTVSGIAQTFKVSIGAIIASNEIRNARRLQEGVVLRIPNIDGIPYSVKAGDSLSRISASFNVPLEVILDVNDVKSDIIKPGETIFIPGARMNDMDLRRSLGDLFIYPVQNRFITSGYGMRRDPFTKNLNFHTGIDLRASTGTPVAASMDGVVSLTGENWLYGKHIIMSHPNGYKTLYAHLHSFSVKQGDRVQQGRKIAEAGNTGLSTGSHLHFSIYDNNNRLINPLDLLR